MILSCRRMYLKFLKSIFVTYYLLCIFNYLKLDLQMSFYIYLRLSASSDNYYFFYKSKINNIKIRANIV